MLITKLPKLQRGDKVAIISPSFAGPARWPHVHELGLQRIREIFDLVPIEFPTTRRIGASAHDRSQDLISAFINPDIKAVIATIGGDDQVTYINNLPREPFIQNPKPFFGYSDNTHFCNFLFLCGVPSFYGASLLTQFAMQGEMDTYSVEYIRKALFTNDEIKLIPSTMFNDIGLDWDNESLLNTRRIYEENEGWYFDGDKSSSGILWGGCVESIDTILQQGIEIPSLEQFKNIVLMLETSEEIPASNYVSKVIRKLGERGILTHIQGVVVGRPKAWEFDVQNSPEQKMLYKKEQREVIIKTVRKYNQVIPIVQNLDFGHTDPQIPMPYGNQIRIQTDAEKIFLNF